MRAALCGRWPDEEYLLIPEAPDGPTRTGRKVDLLVVSLWASRGYQLDAVEVKVSMRDWRRELADPLKSDWWRRHAHRFWIAVPVTLAVRVRRELPDGWGLLACSAPSSSLQVVRAATNPSPEPLPWPASVGLMRAAADAGVQALWRAEARGYQRGRAEVANQGLFA